MRNIVAAATRGIAFAGALLAAAATASAADQQVRIDAVVVEGTAPIQDEMLLQVWSRDGKKALQKVAESHSAPADLALKSGEYRVVAHYRDARVVRDIVVAGPADRHKVINLDAGEIGLELLPGVGRQPLADPILWQVRRYKRGTSSGREVAKISDARPSLLLSEGWYEVVATHGENQTEHVIEVSAGQRFNYSLVKN